MDEAAKDKGTSIVVAVRDNKTYTVAGRDNKISRQAVAGRDNKRYCMLWLEENKRYSKLWLEETTKDTASCGWKRQQKMWLEGQQKIQQAVAGGRGGGEQ